MQLRLEDLDTTRVKSQWSRQLIDACTWLGLDWDEGVVQSERGAAYEAALDQLAAAGRLNARTCSRADRSGGRRAPDGGWAYDKNGKHMAAIVVRYDHTGYKIDYLNSYNLNYADAGEGRRIHPNYNRWIRNLMQRISGGA